METERGPHAPFMLEVDRQQAGERLDKWLRRQQPTLSRARLQRWIAEGRVQVDGQVARANLRLSAGAQVWVQPAPPPPSEAEPQAIPLHILYEDSHLLVLDKAAGLVVHPAPGHPDGTLVNAVLHHTRIEGEDAQGRPGIVHRLDKDTSGVMVVAKRAAAREALIAAFQAHDIERAYDAIALGAWSEPSVLDTWHGRHPVDRKRFTTRVQRGKRAVTRVEPQRALHGSTLVRCRLETGRTHQIRVQLAEHGHPILGDPLYGRRSQDPRLQRAARQLGRQALHATLLGFAHPVEGRWLRFESPLPQDLRSAVETLGESGGSGGAVAGEGSTLRGE